MKAAVAPAVNRLFRKLSEKRGEKGDRIASVWCASGTLRDTRAFVSGIPGYMLSCHCTSVLILSAVGFAEDIGILDAATTAFFSSLRLIWQSPAVRARQGRRFWPAPKKVLIKSLPSG